jgi:hypothetical protein
MPDACEDCDTAVADRVAFAVVAAGAHAVSETASAATAATARPDAFMGQYCPSPGFLVIDQFPV